MLSVVDIKAPAVHKQSRSVFWLCSIVVLFSSQWGFQPMQRHTCAGHSCGILTGLHRHQWATSLKEHGHSDGRGKKRGHQSHDSWHGSRQHAAASKLDFSFETSWRPLRDTSVPLQQLYSCWWMGCKTGFILRRASVCSQSWWVYFIPGCIAMSST